MVITLFIMNIIATITIVCFEKHMQKTLLTPFIVLAVPYMFSIIGAMTLDKLGYLANHVIVEGMLINFIFLIAFFLSQFPVYIAFDKRVLLKKLRFRSRKLHLSLIFYILSIVIAIYLSIKFIQLINYIELYPVLKKKILAYGIRGHLSNISIPLISYLIYNYVKEKNIWKLLLIIFFAFVVFVYKLTIGTKYLLFSFLLTMVYSYVTFNEKKISLKTILVIFISILVGFSATYAVSFSFNNNSFNAWRYDFLSFVLRHISNYMFSPAYNSGIIFYNNITNTNGNVVLLANLYNMYILISSSISSSTLQYKTGIVPIFITFMEGEESNVFGMFADIFFKTGSYFLTFISTFLISIFSYWVFYMSKFTKNTHLRILNIINLSFLSISFFSFWYGQLTMLEAMLIPISLYITTTIIKGGLK